VRVARGWRATARARGPFWIAGVLACLLPQLAGIAHHVMVQHSRCAEHGELVHTGIVASATDSRRDLATPSLQRSASDAAESHEHCAIVVESRKLLISAPTLALADAPTMVEATRWLLATTPDTGRSRYSFAPKTSPPFV
jgi:hypothetical protein